MNDMTGAEVKVGDLLIDDRGKVFVTVATPSSYEREKLILIEEHKTRGGRRRGFVRQNLALKTNQDMLESPDGLKTPQHVLASLWRVKYEQYQRPGNKAEIKQRRKEFQERRKHGQGNSGSSN